MLVRTPAAPRPPDLAGAITAGRATAVPVQTELLAGARHPGDEVRLRALLGAPGSSAWTSPSTSTPPR